MEESLVSMFQSAPYLVSFLAGMLTFVSPCVLPLIPAYLSYISGLSVKQLSGQSEVSLQEKLRVVRASLLFIFGFGSIFVLLGASMASLIDDIFAFEWVAWVAGGIIVIFGLHTMGLVNIKFLNYEVRAHLERTVPSSGGLVARLAGAFAPFLLGVSFALGWTPCIGPIFAAIVSMAAQEETKGIALMVVYTLGLAIPFFLSALLTSSALGLFSKIKQNFKAIEYISGGLLIIIGIAVATGGLGKISAFLTGG